MKSILLLLLAGTVMTAATASAADVREVDLGAVVGEPLGLSGKIWIDEWLAVDFGAGLNHSDAGFWADALWHNWNLLPQPQFGRLAAYVGAGPQVRSGDGGRFGIRAIVGAALQLKDAPVEVFAEAGPLFQLTQGGGLDAVGGVGARYRFGGGAPKPR